MIQEHELLAENLKGKVINMDTNYINLRIRNFENNINTILNDYSDIPIEAKRIVLDKVSSVITAVADIQAKKELDDYQRNNNINLDDCK